MKNNSKKLVWVGRIMSAFVFLFMLFDGVIHVMDIPVVAEAFKMLGYANGIAFTLGVIELVCLALYIIPRTSIVGAILLTGYLGGAVASNVRIGAPLFGNVLFPVYIGILMWGGLYLQDERLRTLVPFKKK